MSFLDHIRACNQRDLTAFRPFHVDGGLAGYVRQDMAEAIRAADSVFRVTRDEVALSANLRTFEQRTAAVEGVLKCLEHSGIMPPWRGEPYAVTIAPGGPALFAIERAAVALFGIRAYGVHLNGYVRKGGRLFLWIGRRSRTKQTYPGMLDNAVAGGLPYGLTARECLVKECGEEAGIPPAWADTAPCAGAITYTGTMPEGLRRDVLYCYDLDLPPDFRPECQDGELEEFMLMPVEEVAAIVRDTVEFKFNCNLVIIDFLVRHGLIGPDAPDYLAIVKGLHQ
jgi:8-oxo-dGTP pyrophosphatase MutT (NUDIX family)